MWAGALFLVFGLIVDVYGGSLNDLIEALNTTRPIWLYKQSYKQSPEAPGRICVHWNKNNLSKTLYIFDNGFKQDGDYHNDKNMHAELSDRGAGVMDVTYKREGGKSTQVYYTLDEWHRNETCFILTRNINGYYACDLYLWEQNLRGRHTACDARYHEICNEGPAVFWEDQCM
uniref:Lipocalin n=1 Tax=Rhipicephalus appendiculatus TaxID=34631 RepID=A0A131YTY4_RHIAP